MTPVDPHSQNDISQARRILVVDDDQGILETYSEILAPRPRRFSLLKSLMDVADPVTPMFELSIANEGEAAVELVRANRRQNLRYGVAFIDMRMPPGMNGLATARAIRAIDTRIFIVIVTAYSDHSLEEINRQLGHSVLFLRKPFSDEEILQIAHTLIEIWRRENWHIWGTDEANGLNGFSDETMGDRSRLHAPKADMLAYLEGVVDVNEWHNKSLDECLMDYETFIIRNVMEHCDGDQLEAAKLLGLKPRVLQYRFRRQGQAAHEDGAVVTLHGIQGGAARSFSSKTLESLVQDFEKLVIAETLSAAQQNYFRAARMLGTSLIGLLIKMRQYELR